MLRRRFYARHRGVEKIYIVICPSYGNPNLERLHVADLTKMRHEKGCPKNVTQHQNGLEHGTFGSSKKLSIEESNEVPKIQEATMTHKA